MSAPLRDIDDERTRSARPVNDAFVPHGVTSDPGTGDSTEGATHRPKPPFPNLVATTRVTITFFAITILSEDHIAQGNAPLGASSYQLLGHGALRREEKSNIVLHFDVIRTRFGPKGGSRECQR